MASAINQGLKNLMDRGDPRLNGYFLMDSPITVHVLLFLYHMFVFKLGPRLMKNREPFVLKKVIMGYNVLQIVLNVYLLIEALPLWPKMSIFCSPIDPSPNDHNLKVINLTYLYTMLKYLDFVDTIFFVLRKKSNQISFLHVYHHTAMALCGWWICKFYPGGQTYFLGLPNCFVHVVMYFYYFLTSWDSSYKKSVWWKRHITELQLVQHCFILVAFSLPLFNPTCNYSKWLLIILYIPQTILMIYLFSVFYIKTYLTTPQKKIK